LLAFGGDGARLRKPADWQWQSKEWAADICSPLFYRGKIFALAGDSKRIADGSKPKKPISDWLKSQGRFSHLLKPQWASVAEEIQQNVDKKWGELLKLCQI
jgi:pyruvate/2-oxoacid:ferredoxin oxidoreductase beta subunit